MKKFMLGVLIGFIYIFGGIAQADTSENIIKEEGIAWGKALESRNPARITSLYAEGAYLYPAFENIKDTHEQILQYFENLSKNDKLKVVFNQEHIQVFGNVAVNSGFYTFSYNKDGKNIQVPARYTFVYLHEGNHWMIVNHHSSILPQKSE